ncbi:MAG TPA: magnesium/cobalt transporter CorA [Longimicrobiales bacterium]|nr:magnesium/cobalt transporter CorA [Longimicrobiales bacterium]
MEPDLAESEQGSHTRVRAFRADGTRVRAIPVAEAGERIRAMLGAPLAAPDGPPIWLDIVAPAESEGEFLRGLGIHQLAVEDCLRGRQRPKIDRFGSHLFIVSYAAHINPERNRVAFTELHLIIGAGFLITVRDHGIPELRAVLARWRAAPTLFREVGHLAHALIDAVVDDYFPIMEHFAERVAELETEIFDDAAPAAMQDILGLRRELVLFRRVVGPERDMLGDVVRRDLPFINAELIPYFMDIRDHAMRIAEELDVLRDLLAATLEGQLSISSNQLNATVRMMTAWSIILMSMAVVSGVYGMNFRHMPELSWRYGYFVAVAIMLAVAGSLFTFFRRRDWI